MTPSILFPVQTSSLNSTLAYSAAQSTCMPLRHPKCKMFKSELLIFPSSPFPPDVVATKRIRMDLGKSQAEMTHCCLPRDLGREEIWKSFHNLSEAHWRQLRVHHACWQPWCRAWGPFSRSSRKDKEGLREAAVPGKAAVWSWPSWRTELVKPWEQSCTACPKSTDNVRPGEQRANQTLLPFTTMLHNPPFVTKWQWGSGQLVENLGEDKAVNERALNVHRNKMGKKIELIES